MICDITSPSLADILLLDNVLQGNWKYQYDGFSKEKIDRLIIFAEFDAAYRYEHSDVKDGKYLCKDRTGQTRLLSQKEYLRYLGSIITDEKNHELKNKVNSSIELLYHIIDGVDLSLGYYEECHIPNFHPNKFLTHNHELYTYHYPITIYIQEHFAQKRIEFLNDIISRCECVKLDQNTVNYIEEVLKLANDLILCPFDIATEKFYECEGVANDKNLTYNLIRYYNNLAHNRYIFNDYKQSMLYLNFAKYYIGKADINDGQTLYWNIIISSNKGFVLYREGKENLAATVFEITYPEVAELFSNHILPDINSNRKTKLIRLYKTAETPLSKFDRYHNRWRNKNSDLFE